MAGLFRFIGILNAAVWCGSAIFLVIGLPGLFSAESKRIVGQFGVGFAAETIFARFFILQYVCAGIAFAYLIAGWLLSKRAMSRLSVVLLTLLTALALLGGLWVQPTLRDLHVRMYYSATPQQRELAGKAFRAWHGGSQIANLLVMMSLILYLWDVTEARESPRFVTLSKIRS